MLARHYTYSLFAILLYIYLKKVPDFFIIYGIKTSQKRKENEELIYGKYRQIYAKKAMAVKRNPDIEYYKTNYEKWKKEAKEFINDIKSGKKTYDEFDEWLDKN